MNSLNSILAEGNLTKDPVFTENSKGTSICSFSIAVNRYYKQEDEYQNEVSYLDVETWARLAEVCRDHLAKGRGVRVVGRVKQDRWVDQDGKNRSKVKIVAEHVEFKPFKKNDDSKEEANKTKEEIEEPEAVCIEN
ncbi:MAG: single-stranded DNA-binding protein [Spirochaetes bacterium]|nr:single-stranded DNA-binding protein [Spirochaetota bacterium]